MTRRVGLWIAAVLTAAGLMAGLAVAAHAGVGQAHPSVALYPTAVEYAVMSFGFAIYSAARDRYEDAVLLTGSPAGTLQEALDTACTVHRAGLGHEPPTNLRGRPLKQGLPDQVQGSFSITERVYRSSARSVRQVMGGIMEVLLRSYVG